MPAPVIRRGDIERLVHKDPALFRGRELAAIPRHPIKGFDLINKFPRLPRANYCRRERERMKCHIILAHELHILHILRAFIGAPPVFPISPSFRSPILCRCDIFNRSIKPHVENFAVKAVSDLAVLIGDGNAPFQIARNGTVTQALVEPFQRNRCRKGRPAFGLIHPIAKLIGHVRLFKVKMVRIAHLDVFTARHRRVWVYQINGIQKLAAIITLVSARFFITTIGACSFDITVWQKTTIGIGVDLLGDALFNQIIVFEHMCKFLSKPAIARRRGAAKVIKGKLELSTCRFLLIMHLGAICGDIHICGLSSKLGRRTVLIRGANIKHLMSHKAHCARIDICGQHGPCQIPQMFDAVNIRQCRCD